MELLDTIKTRRSVRSFLPDAISDDIMTEILQAGRLAPSAQNRQCWRFVVVRDEELKQRLSKKSGLVGKINFFIAKAPVIIIAAADPKRSVKLNGQEYYLVDTAIAFQQMMLTAWNFGIGSCWLAAFNEQKVKDILAIPPNIRVVAMSPFGYPRESDTLYAKAVSFVAKSKKRMDLEEIVHYDIWGNKE